VKPWLLAYLAAAVAEIGAALVLHKDAKRGAH
jgi:hypothetical protein